MAWLNWTSQPVCLGLLLGFRQLIESITTLLGLGAERVFDMEGDYNSNDEGHVSLYSMQASIAGSERVWVPTGSPPTMSPSPFG